MAKKDVKPGRPSLYKPEYNDQVYKLCLLGATDVEIADFFNVNPDTIYEWKKQYQEFSESIKRGKDLADATIAESLYHRAKGYSHPEDKIFNDQGAPLIVPSIKHYPPDTTAGIFWLKNRKPAQWRDKQEIQHSGTVSHDVKHLSDDELERIAAEG